MNTPDTPEENQFDDLLRNSFAGFRAQPDATVWEGIKAGVRTQPPTLWQRLRPVGAGMILGAMLVGVAPRDSQGPATPPATPVVTLPASAPEPQKVTGQSGTAAARPIAQPILSITTTRPAHFTANPTTRRAATVTSQPLAPIQSPRLTAAVVVPISLLPTRDSATTSPAAEPATGAVVVLARQWRAGLALDTALHAALWKQRLPERPADAAGQPTPAATDSAATQRVRTLLLAEAALLRTLTQRNDSLLRTLEEEPIRPLVALDSAAPRSAATLPPPRRWAVAIGSELTGGWGTLPGFDDHATEQLRSSLTHSVSIAHQLNDRWRLRAGLGDVSVRTQLRYQRDSTGQAVRFDTTLTSTLQVSESIDTSYIVLIRQVMHLEPHYNDIGQPIYYDTTYIPVPDTTYQVTFSHDTVRTNQTTVTRHVDTWRTSRQQTLRPEYRFWTIPIAAQYALLVRGRLRLGVSVGAQVLVFRGGNRPVLRGDEYTLQRVGPRDGPFRPVSVAWQGSADLEWRFGPRLSAALSPGLRGWAIRPERGLSGAARPLPSVQLGLTWGF